MNQDNHDQTAILACMVDFQKAFNRINHNIVIAKLSDMGVPGWLLKIVIAFLTKRKMQVRYKGQKSSIKDLSGGGPQGTLLGLLLFIILINDVGFNDQQNNLGELLTSKKNLKKANHIHLKYVDDLSLAEVINLQEKLEPAPKRTQPDTFHARTGHVLPVEKSEVYKQLLKTDIYARKNEMKINQKKTQLMVFNPCKSIDFQPEISLNGQQLQVIDEMKLLGVIIKSDLSWHANTQYIVNRANKRLWMLRRLVNLGANRDDLLEIYRTQVRSVLELAVPVWQGNLSQLDKINIERVQKSALHIILGDKYACYKNAIKTLNIDDLETRRNKLCLKFGKKCETNDKFKHWFKFNNQTLNTRQAKTKYVKVKARLYRLEKSPISFLTNMLNHHYSIQK